jgi:hypothetical protein
MNRYLSPLLLIAVTGAICVGYVQGAYAGIQESLRRKDELKLDIEDAKNAQSELAKFAALVGGFPPDGEERITKMVPDKVDPIRLIVDVDALAQTFGLTLNGPKVSLRSQELDSVAEYDEYAILFSVSAPYKIFRSFLHGIEDSLALRDSLRVSFKSSGTSGVGTDDDYSATKIDPSLMVYEYQVELSTYSLRGPVKAPL